MNNNCNLSAFFVTTENGNQRMGYVNTDQKVCIAPIYYAVVKLPNNKTVFNHDGIFKNDLAVVMNADGKFGLINPDGDVVVNLRYDSLSNVITNGMIFFREGTTCGFMRLDESTVLEYPNCTSLQLKEGTIYSVEYENGKKKIEVDLSSIQ